MCCMFSIMNVTLFIIIKDDVTRYKSMFFSYFLLATCTEFCILGIYQFWNHLGILLQILTMFFFFFFHLSLFYISGGKSETMHRVAYIEISYAGLEVTFICRSHKADTDYRVFLSVNNFYEKNLIY